MKHARSKAAVSLALCIWLPVTELCCAQTGHIASGDPSACVHPVNFQCSTSSVDGELLLFTYTWESPTGDRQDLKNVGDGEFVIRDGDLVPTWYSNDTGRNPILLPHPFIKGGPALILYDTHRPPGGRLPDKGPPSTLTSTQYYGYHCFLCGQGRGAVWTHGWLVDLDGPIQIVRKVYEEDHIWKYSIEKEPEKTVVDIP